MLVTSMSCKEMFYNLASDKEKVDIKKEYLRSRAIKELKKKSKFPAYVWYEYKIPTTQNKYFIFFYAANRWMVEKPEVESFCELFDDNKRFIIKWGVCPYKHCENREPMLLPLIHAYSSHFFQRYKERYLKDETLSTNDVIFRFLARNGKEFFPIKITNEINNNIEKYGIAGEIGCIVTDGFCFIQSNLEGTPGENKIDDKIDAMMLIYTTFISKNEMGESQYEAIKAGQETALSYLKDFCEKYKDRDFELEK